MNKDDKIIVSSRRRQQCAPNTVMDNLAERTVSGTIRGGAGVGCGGGGGVVVRLLLELITIDSVSESEWGGLRPVGLWGHLQGDNIQPGHTIIFITYSVP